MIWKVLFTPMAERALDGLDAPIRDRMIHAIDRLCQNPLGLGAVKKLTGKFAGYLRYRSGDWRIIFSLNHRESTITIVDIAHRREVYD